MTYKEKLDLSELNSSVLPNLVYFIQDILNLTDVYGNSVRMPIAKPPQKTFGYSTAVVRLQGAYMDDGIEGKYQDEALLIESAETRTNKLSLLKKLGCVDHIRIDDRPLAEREVSFELNKERTLAILDEIEGRLSDEREKQSKLKLLNSQFSYDSDTLCLTIDSKRIQMSEQEDALCALFFNPSNKLGAIDITAVIEELTGDMYSKSENPGQFEKVRQMVARINTKIKKTIGLEQYLIFQKRTNKIAKNKNV